MSDTRHQTDQSTQAAPADQLFVALSTRWRRDDGSLAFGIPETSVLHHGEMTARQWKDRQVELRAQVEAWGLELISYVYCAQTWWCLRSLYAVPPELDDKEMAVLAVFFYRTVPDEEGAQPLTAPWTDIDSLRTLLVQGGYLTTHSLDRVLRQLQEKGYLKRVNRGVRAETRLLLEVPAENRRYLAQQVARMIV